MIWGIRNRETRPDAVDAGKSLISPCDGTERPRGMGIGEDIAMDEDKVRSAERLAEFNRLLATVHAIAADAADEFGLLQAVCEEAVRQEPLGLVWCGTPDDQGFLQVRAAGGRTQYLDGIRISVDPQRTEGQGLSGQTWRDGQTRYEAFMNEDPTMQLWRLRAEQNGLTGVVAVRIDRQGSPWGLLNLYLTQGAEFEPEIRLLLDEVARTVARGLDRLDGRMREVALIQAQRVLLDHADAGIALCQEGTVTFANPHLVHLLGYGGLSDLLGQSVLSFCGRSEDRVLVEQLLALVGAEGQGTLSGARLKRQDGRIVIVDMAMSRTHDGIGDTVVWTVQDVTERARMEEVLASHAYTDAVTGLANRWAFESELEHRLMLAKVADTVLALCLLDLDNFKQVNDTWGHTTGDAVLRELSGRLAAQLGAEAFVGRTGGDEFVIIVDGMDLRDVGTHMEALVSHLHKIVEVPMEATPSDTLMDFSMGIAVFPEDGANAADLMRAADQALYRVKRHKHDRIHWWQRAGSESELESTEALEPEDPYAPSAAALLQSVRPIVEEAASRWSELFYEMMEDSPSDAKILYSLPPSLRNELKAQRLALADAVLDPDVRREEVARQAHAFGQVLTLVGSPLSWRTRSVAGYQEVLTEALDRLWMSARDRYRLQRVIEKRLHEVLGIMLETGETTVTAYLEFLGQDLPASGLPWVEAAQTEAARLAELPGISAAFVVRLGASGEVTLESSAGAEASHVTRRFGNDAPYLTATVAHLAEKGQEFRIRDLREDPRADVWQDSEAFGVRSLMAIPIVDRNKRFVAGLYIAGRYPYQFESTAMRQFAQGLRARWELLWRRATSSRDAVNEDTAQQYRDRLFGGGLEMHVQPVVDLHTGQVVSVEALARLCLRDGRVLPPGVFVPLLSQDDLARLFRLGLDQALRHRQAFVREGIDVRVAVNLPPSCLLLPELPGWVAEAVSRHRMEPSCLSLELLETQYIDEQVRDAAVEKLVDLGVGIALDDLGSGYSSLMRLASLPLRTVKIDQGLVRRIHHDPARTFAVIDALSGLGRRLGRDVVAEGLETPDMIEAVQLLGVPLGQGYGFARPMPAGQFIAWSKAFVPPRPPDRTVRSMLGAAAYDWKYGHHGALEACPLTAFLRIGEYGDPEIWHEAVHRGSPESRHALEEWLTRQLAESAPGRARN